MPGRCRMHLHSSARQINVVEPGIIHADQLSGRSGRYFFLQANHRRYDCSILVGLNQSSIYTKDILSHFLRLLQFPGCGRNNSSMHRAIHPFVIFQAVASLSVFNRNGFRGKTASTIPFSYQGILWHSSPQIAFNEHQNG